MNIKHLKTNHLVNPLGFDLANPTISYVVTDAAGKHQVSAQVQVSLKEDFSEILYDSGACDNIVSTGFELPVDLQPMTRYYWKVRVTDETGDSAVSETQWFETAKTVTGHDCTWEAKWITPKMEKDVQAAVWREIEITKPVVKARAYMVGLGLYEFYVNGEKQGDECLLPGFCDYDSWLQYQTYDLHLETGKSRIEMVLGDGWYKGRYGMRKLYENYGDRLAALAEIHIWYEDGTEEIIGTDETWKSRKSQVVSSGIYSGETYDTTLDVSETFGTELIDLGYDRLSPEAFPADHGS